MNWAAPAVLLLVFCTAGCSSLLPHSEARTIAAWVNFEEARRTFDRIAPYKTTNEDLKKLALDPYANPNITILNYSDLARRLLPNGLMAAEYLDPALRGCFAARERCSAYELDQKHMERNRTGNFLLDFFNFRRITDVTGWRFNAVIVLNEDLVVYKLWSGQPAIYEVEKEHNPLGPLQALGQSGISLP
jgi:hypothetical protein